MRAVKRRKMNFRQAERAYNVPASTLHYALKDPLIGKRGRTRLLGPEEEQAVVRYCEDLMRMGRPITKRQLKLNVVVSEMSSLRCRVTTSNVSRNHRAFGSACFYCLKYGNIMSFWFY